MKILPSLLIECDTDEEARHLVRLSEQLMVGKAALAGPTLDPTLDRWMTEAAGVSEALDTSSRRITMALQVAPVRFALSAAYYFEGVTLKIGE